MARTAETLVMYTQPSDAEPLPWSWVDEELAAAGTYWVITGGVGHPHPRPVWGIWNDELLHLSVGSPALRRDLGEGTPVTVHLSSDTDVVIVEGRATGTTAEPALVARYDEKYDWRYDADRYGPFRTVEPVTVLAWRSAGWAGRDGFRQTGRWRY